MINRLILNKLKEEFDQPEICILLGPRQVGKTTLLRALEKYAAHSNLSTTFFDLEQPQVLAEFNLPPQDIIEKIQNAGKVIFIDEFQYLENASKIFKAIYDSNAKIKLFCSGSSSLEIHRHLKESLAGRRILFRLYPLSYSEIKSQEKDYSLNQYLCYGGMPALTQTSAEKRKQVLLSELLSAYILKDVKSLVKEENVRAFNHLLYLLAQHQGSLLSLHSLANEINMSFKAVNRYLDILEQTFVCFRVHSFSHNLGNELKKSSKAYLFDLGIRNAVLRDFSSAAKRQDRGALLESFVFLKLQTMLGPNRELKFWRTKEGHEVDFILLTNRVPLPIEVKSRMEKLEIPAGLRRFLLRYPKTARALVVNENQTGTLQQENCEIIFLTAEDFDRRLPSILTLDEINAEIREVRKSRPKGD